MSLFSTKRAATLMAAAILSLTLAPTVCAQVQEQAPLSLSGNVGFGYSDVNDGQVSRSSPVASVDSDLNGYWRDPRILLFDFAPYATAGNSTASDIDIGNRGKGFNSSMTFLGGSMVPLSLTYTRMWQHTPTYYSNNPLSGLTTSLSDSTFAVDTGVYWGKLPPLTLHYGNGSNDTDYAEGIGNSHNSFRAFGASTYYSLLGWRLTGAYTVNRTDAQRVNLEDLDGPTVPETTDTRDLHLEAQRQSRLADLTVVGGERKWKENATGFQNLDTDYTYAHVLGTMRPFKRLSLSFTSAYDSDDTAYAIQQLLGVQQSSSTQGVLLPGVIDSTSSNSLTIGGGAQLFLPKGFSVSGDANAGSFSSLGPDGSTMLWDSTLNYLHRIGRSGSLAASYGYQHAETSGSAIDGTSDTRALRVGASGLTAYKFVLGANMHFDQRELTSNSATLGHINSPGHDYGLAVDATRQVTNRIKLTLNADYTNGHTDYPVSFDTKTTSFGVRADTGAWQLSLHRSYQQGLAVQVGNSLVYVGDSQQAVLTPLNRVLSQDKDVQTVVTGLYQPGRKRLRISASWIRFGFDNRGVHATDANIYNFIVGYRLRLLQLQAGYYRSSSQAYAINNSSPFVRRQVYFEVIRHFNLF